MHYISWALQRMLTPNKYVESNLYITELTVVQEDLSCIRSGVTGDEHRLPYIFQRPKGPRRFTRGCEGKKEGKKTNLI